MQTHHYSEPIRREWWQQGKRSCSGMTEDTFDTFARHMLFICRDWFQHGRSRLHVSYMLILCHRCHIKKRCHLCAMSYWRVFNWFRCFSSDISLTNLQAKRTHFNEQSAFDAIGSISHSLLPVNLLSSLDANVWWILLKVSCSRIAGSNLIIDRGVLFGFRASSLQQYLIMLNTVEGVHCVQKILRVWYPLIIWMISSFMYLSSRNPFARERTWVLVCAQKWPRHLIINSSCPRQA